MSTSGCSDAEGDSRALRAECSGRAAGERLDTSVALAFFMAAFSFGAWRLRYGIGLSDESFYLATPLRYALGDLPFRDEIYNPARMFDLLLAPLFAFIPNLGVLDLRIGWLCVQLATTGALFALLRRYAPSSVVAAACTSVLFLPNIYWTPSYHLIGTFGFVLAWSLWLMACLQSMRSRATCLGLLAGLAYGIAGIAYLPALAAGVVPAAVLLVALVRRASIMHIWATGAFLATLCSIAVAGVLAVWSSGLLDDWLEAQRSISATFHYSGSTAQMGIEFAARLADTRVFFLSGLGIAGMLLLLCGTLSRAAPDSWADRAGVYVMGAVGFGVPYALLSFGTMPAAHFYITVYAVPFEITALIGGIACLSFGREIVRRRSSTERDESQDASSWGFVALTLTSGSLIFAFVQGFLSVQAFKVMFAIVPLTAVAAVALYRGLITVAPSPPRHRRALVTVIALCAAVAVDAYAYRAKPGHGTSPIAEKTAVFRHPRMAGVRESPEVVDRLEAVAAAIERLVEPGDLLLAYYDGCLVHFMTSTRPAMDHAWTTPFLPAALLRRSVASMIERDRVPTYAVEDLRTHGSPAIRQRVVPSFVRTYYKPHQELDGYRIWKLVKHP